MATWVKLATATASSGDSITSPVFTAKKHLKIMLEIDASSDGKWRFGNATIDTNNNYTQADTANGGTRTGGVNRSNIECSYGSTPQFIKMEIGNIANREKLGIGEVVSAATGGGNTPNRKESNFKWVNTSNQINIVQSYGWNTISYAILTVWGSDDVGTDVYPNFSNGAIFEESDTGKHYMWDGSSTWNEVT